MGATRVTTMRAIVIVAVLALAVNAIPSSDVVPETELFDESADDYAKAKATVQSLLEAGKNDKACRDLATSSKKAIEDDVKADQKILDALPDGSDCAKKGQALVTSTKAEADKAAKAEKDAKAAHDKASKANVDFGSIPYNQLTPGQCGTFFNHASYTKAKAAQDAAKKKYDTAKGSHDAAKQAFADATASAANQKSRCLCKTKKAHDSAYKKIAASKHNAGIDWDTAHKVICVLDKTPASKCAVPAQPKVSAPKIDAAAAAMPLTCKDTIKGMAMKIKDNMEYNNAAWTNTVTGKLGNGNEKTSLFNEPMKSLTVSFSGVAQSVGPIPLNGKSLQEIFSSGSFLNSSPYLAASAWRLSGWGWQKHCNKQGLNVKTNVASRWARVGIIMNQENDCNTPDTMIGAGFSTKNGGSATAGSFVGCCQSGGSGSSNSATVTLTVEG